MPRAFGSNFTTEKNKATTPAPFLSAIFRSPVFGDLPVVGRAIAGLGGNQPVINSVTHYAIVKDWGRFGSGLGSQVDGTADVTETQITLTNLPVLPGGVRFSDYFDADLETVPIDIFWNFLVGTTVYQEAGPSGAAKMPSSWNFRDVTLSIGSLMDFYLGGHVLTEVKASMFADAPQGSIGKAIPVAIGDTTASTLDGARIPAICIDAGQGSTVKNGLDYVSLRTGGRRTKYIACETRTSLVAASVGSVYWGGHKIVETPDYHMATTGGSKTVSLHVLAAGQTFASAGLIPDIFDVGFLGPMGSYANGTKRLGDDRDQISHIIQPFVADGDVEIVNTSIAATKWDEPDAPFEHVRPLVMGIMDSDDAAMHNGILGTPTTLSADAVRVRRRADANDVRTSNSRDDPFTLFDSSTYFNMHGYVPRVGMQHYAVHYIAGANAGIADDSANSWYNIALKTSLGGDLPIYSGIRLNQPAYAVGFDGSVTALGGYVPIQFFTNIRSLTANVITDEDGGTDSQVGATGIFHMGIEPEDAIAIGMVKLRLRKQKATSALGNKTLKGSITISISELDALGLEVTQVASAEFQADEYNDLLADDSYSDAIKTFSSTALLLAGHRYKVRIDGQVDINGEFTGWVVKAITAADFSNWVSSLTSVRGSVAGFGGPVTTRQEVTTTETETCAIDLTLYTVRFNRAVESFFNPATGAAISCWTLEAICGPADSVYFVPEGTDISTDIECATTRPDEVIHALANLAGVPDDRIDLAASFADAGAHYGSAYKFRGAVTEQQTYKALLSRLAFEARSELDWEVDKLQLKWLPAPGDSVTPARTVTLDKIPRMDQSALFPDFHFTRTETTEIINVVPILYQRMFNMSGRDAYLLGDEFFSVPSITHHKQKRRDELFQLDYVRDTTMAEGVGLFYILWLAFARHKPIFTTKLDYLEILKADVLSIDLTALSSSAGMSWVLGGGGSGDVGGDGGFVGGGGEAFAGWVNHPILVRAIQYDWGKQQIQFTGVDQA